MMKYKVGDRVKIREWEDMEKEYGLDENGDINCPGFFLGEMKKYCGKEAEVVGVAEYSNHEYHLSIDEDGWEWPECALLPVEESKKKPVAYISGAITGLDDYQKAFLHAKSTIEEKGYSAINPAELKSVLHTEASYEDYMDICLMLVEKADFLVLLPGWEKSPGANREMGYAKGLDKTVMTLEEICETTNTRGSQS